MPSKPGPIPTLRELRSGGYWLWLHCANSRCRHARPVIIVHLMLALGVDASSNVARARAVCPSCGCRGVTIMMPSYVDTVTGSAPYPRVSDPNGRR